MANRFGVKRRLEVAEQPIVPPLEDVVLVVAQAYLGLEGRYDELPQNRSLCQHSAARGTRAVKTPSQSGVAARVPKFSSFQGSRVVAWSKK